MDLKVLQAKRDERNTRLGVSEEQYRALHEKLHELQWADAKSADAKEIYAFIHTSRGVARHLLDKHGIR